MKKSEDVDMSHSNTHINALNNSTSVQGRPKPCNAQLGEVRTTVAVLSDMCVSRSVFGASFDLRIGAGGSTVLAYLLETWILSQCRYIKLVIYTVLCLSNFSNSLSTSLTISDRTRV